MPTSSSVKGRGERLACIAGSAWTRDAYRCVNPPPADAVFATRLGLASGRSPAPGPDGGEGRLAIDSVAADGASNAKVESDGLWRLPVWGSLGMRAESTRYDPPKRALEPLAGSIFQTAMISRQ